MTDTVASDIVHVGEYFALLRREKWRALGVAFIIAAATVTVATVWPPTYRATATILIEEADIPADLVSSTVRALASERIQAIQQRIMTTTNLAAIITKFNLYPEERKTWPLPSVAELMRGNIVLSLVNTETASKNSRDTRAAIAFTLSFDGDNPRTTQQVTSEIASLFLAESQRERDQRASGTTSFLEAESRRLNTVVQTLESQIEAFRTENAGLLPEDRLINTELLDRADSQLMDLARQLHTLRERQGIARAQLAGTPAHLPIAADRTALSPADQLALLLAKRTEMSARYGAKHPDVVALDRQINALNGIAAGGLDATALRLQVQSLQADLQKAKQKYGSKHPDALKLQRELTAAQEQLAAAPVPRPAPQPSMSNPSYLQLQAELASITGELEAALTQQTITQEKKAQIEERILRGPGVEKNYIALKRDYDAAVAKYLEVRAKEAEAELTRNLENQRMGETLTLIEPPVEPTAPIKPNRLAILAIGLIAAIAGGIMTGILHDAADERVHGWRQLASISGQTPFAVVPLIRTDEDQRRARQATLLQFLLGFLLLTAALFYVSSFSTALEVLWTDLAEHFGVQSDAPTAAN